MDFKAMTPELYVNVYLLLVSTTVFAWCCVPPNPPLKQHDRKEIRGILEHGDRSRLVQIFGVTQLFMGIAECTIVVCHAVFPTAFFWSSLSRYIFFFEDPMEVSNIRMTPLRALGALMMIGGGLLRLVSFRTLGRLFTFEVGIQKDHRLITTFPYSIVRHPAYAAVLLTHPGCLLCGFMRGGWLRESGVLNSWFGGLYFSLYAVFVASFPFIVLLRMGQEDDMLRRKFGKEWVEWSGRVRFMLIPGLY